MEQNQDTIFPTGRKAPADTFTGTVYVQALAAKSEMNDFSVASVTFEPGAPRVLALPARRPNHPGDSRQRPVSGEGQRDPTAQQRRCRCLPAGCRTLARRLTGGHPGA